MKKAVLPTLFILFISASAMADKINTTFFGKLAVKGYDTVAYFSENKPVQGKKEFEYNWKDANWRFSSQENLELFKSNPEKYAPQYGGYCAYAVSNNTTADIEPEQFTVYNGKLYLNYNKKINARWTEDKDEYIERADENWPSVLD